MSRQEIFDKILKNMFYLIKEQGGQILCDETTPQPHVELVRTEHYGNGVWITGIPRNRTVVIDDLDRPLIIEPQSGSHAAYIWFEGELVFWIQANYEKYTVKTYKEGEWEQFWRDETEFTCYVKEGAESPPEQMKVN